MQNPITSHQMLLDYASQLAAENPDMGRALARVEAELGPLPDRARAPGFASLLFLIAAQQVSNASAQAIWRRIEAGVSPLTPEVWCSMPGSTIDTLGLSRPKKIYARALGEALLSGSLELDALSSMGLEEAEAHLCQVKGIGPWTAQAYLLFSHGLCDAWPAGDIAVHEAMRRLLDLEERPSTKEALALAEAWRPLRGIAAHILWAYYKVL